MVALPAYTIDPTIEKMFEVMEANHAQKAKRDYLGASMIGDPCERKIWYSYKGTPREPMGRMGIMATEDGHHAEKIMADRLRLVPGIELWTEDENGQQFGFKDFEDKFGGHIDGVITGLIQAPSTPHIWEHKCCNEKKFNEFLKAKDQYGEKNALEAWDVIYFAQAQIYMKRFDLTRHYLTVALAGSRNVASCRTDYQRDRAQSFEQKALRVIKAVEPPARISERKEFYVCKWCAYREECWK